MGEEMNWISVSENLPEMRPPYTKAAYSESSRVLVFTGHMVLVGKYAETFTKRKTRWEESGTGRVIGCVTHWMPLPDPPNVMGKKVTPVCNTGPAQSCDDFLKA